MKAAAPIARIALAAMVMATAGNAPSLAATSTTFGGFNFGYLVSGVGRIQPPIQIFDDGVGKTYFQFRVGQTVPAIFSATGELLVPTAEGPYHWVSSLARDFTLVLGEARLRVRHSSVPAGVVDPLLPLPGAAGAAEVAARNTRDLTQSSFAAPVRGDVIEWRKEGRPVEQPVLFVKGSRDMAKDVRAAIARLGVKIGETTKVVVVGREDQSMKEGLAEGRAKALRDALVDAGVPRENIATQIGAEIGAPTGKGKSQLVASTIRWTPVTVVAAPEPQRRPAQAHAPASVQLPPPLPALALPAALAQATPAASAPVAEAGKGASVVSPALPAPVSHLQSYDIRARDGSAADAIGRWASAAGYELVWEAPRPAIDMHVEAANFLDAVKHAMANLKRAGYPVKAIAYSDRVVQVIKE